MSEKTLMIRHGIFPVLTGIPFFHLRKDHFSRSSRSGLILFDGGEGG